MEKNLLAKVSATTRASSCGNTCEANSVLHYWAWRVCRWEMFNDIKSKKKLRKYNKNFTCV